MSLAAESPSPSSSTGSDDFAALLDTELDLASAADSASPGDPSASSSSDDDDGGDGEDEEVVVEVEAVEQSSTKRRRVEEQRQDQGTSMRPDEDATGSSKDAQIKICPPHLGFIGGLCFICGKRQEGEDVSGVAFGYIHKVWQKHKENLILMERYHYFASSCHQFSFGVKSLSESMQDERESDAALATILDVLKRIHTIFFDSAVETAFSLRDVRQVIKRVRQEVLQGCKLVFSRVFPNNARPQDQIIWKMAEQMGAVCCAAVDSTVTHVVAVDLGTEKARWAVDNKKFLVHPRWIEAANFRWHRQQEEDFSVASPKEKSTEKEKCCCRSYRSN